jgi:hypothetical protein
MNPIRIAMDANLVRQQVKELLQALERAPQGFQDDLLAGLERLVSDVCIDEGVTTRLTDGTTQILYPMRLGDEFESFLAAVRASDAEGVSHG